MSPSPNLAVYTLHDTKTVLTSDSGSGTENVKTTVVKGWMTQQKKVSGMLLKAGVTEGVFPVYNNWLQTASHNGNVTGFQDTLLQAKNWDHSRFVLYPPTSKMLLFDRINNAIGNGDAAMDVVTKGDIANFKSSFYIEELSVANGYGNTIDAITDVFTHMRENDYSSEISTKGYIDSSVIRETVSIPSIDAGGDAVEPTTAVISGQKNGENEAGKAGFEFFTENWGSGFTLTQLYMVQESVSVDSSAPKSVLSTAILNDGVDLSSLPRGGFTANSGKSEWNSTGYNEGAAAEIKFVSSKDDIATTAQDGWKDGTASFYVQFSNLGNSDSGATGTFLVKAGTTLATDSLSFGAGNLIGVSLSLDNLASNLAVTEVDYDVAGDAIKYGAKTELQFNITAGQNPLYVASGSTIVPATTPRSHIHVSKVKRSREDSAKTSGVLYGEGEITLVDADTKFVTSDTEALKLEDNYGIYHSAIYKYTATVKSELTGRSIQVEKSVTTKPGLCRNLVDNPVTSTDSGIYAIWENAKATGAVEIEYDFKVTKIKFMTKAFDREGVVVPDAVAEEVEIDYNYLESDIGEKHKSIQTVFLPGLDEKVTATVVAKNTSGSGPALEATNLSVVESADTESSALTGVNIKVLQNPIEIGTDAESGESLPTLGADDAEIESISKDSFNYIATYESNYVELTVPSDTANVQAYRVYVNGRYYGEVQASTLVENKIIVAGCKSNMADETQYGISEKLQNETVYHFAVIAVYDKSGATSYSKAPSFNFSITTYPKPDYPPPLPVTGVQVLTTESEGQTEVEIYNSFTVSCTIPANSFIETLELYQVPFVSDYQGAYGKQLQIAGSTPVLTGDDAKNMFNHSQADIALFTDHAIKLKTAVISQESGTFTFDVIRQYADSDDDNKLKTWGDNMFGAFVILAYNENGVRSTNIAPTWDDDNEVWVYDPSALIIMGTNDSTGTTNYARTVTVGKTRPPKQATTINVTPSAVKSNINLLVALPTPNYKKYSHDTPLRSKIDVLLKKYGALGSNGGASVSIMGETLKSVFPYTFNTSNSDYKDKVCQKTRFEATVVVSTNMQPTWAEGTDSFQDETIKEEFTTKGAPYVLVAAGNYTIDKQYEKNEKPCLNAEPYVINRTNGAVSFLEYPALDSGSVLTKQMTAPPCLYPEWRKDSTNPEKSTNFILSGNHNPGFVAGDIVFVMNKTNGATLDSLVLSQAHIDIMDDANAGDSTDSNVLPVLQCSKRVGDFNHVADDADSEYVFGYWCNTTKAISRLHLESAYKTDSDYNIQGNEITDSSNLTSIADGAQGGAYVKVKLAYASRTMKTYVNGFESTSATNQTASSGSYAFTAINALTGDNVTICNNNGVEESDPALESQPYGGISSLSYVYARSNKVKVIYDASTVNQSATNKLYLNKSSTTEQTFTFTNSKWNFLAFHVVDTDKTKWKDLFDTDFFGSNPSVSKVLVLSQAGMVWQQTSTDNIDIDIDYDQGFYVKVVGADTTMTKTGKQIRGIRTEITAGINFMGYPSADTSISGKTLLGYAPDDTTKLTYETLFMWFEKLIDPEGNNLDIAAKREDGETLEDITEANFTFNQGKGTIVYARTPNGWFNWGLMESPGLIGDISGAGSVPDGNVDNLDVIALGQYLAYKDQGKSTVEGMEEAKRFEQCNYNKNLYIDIGDAVILASKVAGLAAFADLENLAVTPSGYNPDPYSFEDSSKKTT